MPHTTTEKMIKEIVEGLFTELEAFTRLDGTRIDDKEGIKIVQEWLSSSLTKLSEFIKREILEKAPKDEHHMEESNEMQFGINSTNKEWREIINNLR